MSLIRSTSNREGLYVTGGWGQPIEIMSGRGWELSNIGPNNPALVVPSRAFLRVCRLAGPHITDAVEADGFRAEEVYVYTRTGRPVPELRHGVTRSTFRGDAAPRDFMIRLSYRDRFVLVYRVTWEYLRREALAQDKEERAERQKRQVRCQKVRAKWQTSPPRVQPS